MEGAAIGNQDLHQAKSNAECQEPQGTWERYQVQIITTESICEIMTDSKEQNQQGHGSMENT